ncbi:MAG: hypothetical protein CR986_06990 [Ignavibacteriae bacterium]|nr:MAG: hypothetical protein CR986_06990 [Ignavibacteriota bacterium]
MIEIKKYNKNYFVDLNKYLKSNKYATPFHLSEWYNIIESVYGHKNETLLALEDNKVCGVLPLSLIKVPFTKGYLASGPFSSHCEILGDSDEIKAELLDYAIKLTQSLNTNYSEIKNISNINIVNQTSLELNTAYCSMVLECDNEDKIWKNLSKTLRNEIRNGIKNNLTLSDESDKVKLLNFYKLLAITMKRHGTPIHSFQFYKNLFKKIENTEIINIEYEGKIIATNLLFGYNKTLHSLASASDGGYWKYKPNQYLWWECIKFALNNGYQYLDFGRSKVNQGTFLFKSKFGAKPVYLNYIYYLNKIKSMPNINDENTKFKFATSLWSKLPLSLTKQIGPYLIKYVS